MPGFIPRVTDEDAWFVPLLRLTLKNLNFIIFTEVNKMFWLVARSVIKVWFLFRSVM